MKSKSTGNLFLDALAPETTQRLIANARLVDLPIQTSLARAKDEPGYVWFLTSGVASVTFTAANGTTIELATLGKEGVVGSFAALGSQQATSDCGMQIGGAGYRMPTAVFQAEFRDSPEVRDRLLEFFQQQMDLAYQIAACNRLHRAKERFARWLLMVQDRQETDVLHMTQEFLANMLGTRRTTVVEVAGELHRLAAIKHRRGMIRISDRKKLEAQTCECYPLLKKRYDELYASPAGMGVEL